MDELFTGGQSHSLVAYPLRAVYMVKPAAVSPNGEGQQSEAPSAQILVSVSKRRFKHAVDRNRAKRQVREAYRLNKTIIVGSQPVGAEQGPVSLFIAFIWLADKPMDSRRVNASMKELLHKLNVRHRVNHQ